MALKKRGTALCVALALVTALAPWLPVRAQSDSVQKTDGPGYIVKLRDDMPRLLSADTPGESLGLGMYRVDDVSEVDDLIAAGVVEFVEPNYTYYLLGGDLVDDQYYRLDGYQWNLDFMDVGPLWKLGDQGLTGQGITVAVLDTGLAAHEDLPEERMLAGYNAVKRTDGDAYDIQGHGTFVSGIIAAEANNKVGVAGVAPKASILPCMVFRDTTAEATRSSIGASAEDLIAAIQWATDQGADVINLSLGSGHPSYALQEAVDYAVERGVIVVAAAGNDGDTTLIYPAANAKVIGVGALGEVSNMNDSTAVTYTLKPEGKGNWAQYSNYNTSVFVTAPGTQMYSTTRTWGATSKTYASASGTSCAAPCVAGLAALAKEYDENIDTAQFQNLLALTAVDRGDEGWDPKYGYGSVNAANMAAALPERSITYNLNGGDWQEGEPTPAQTAFRTYQTEPVALPVPIREGYAFMGWYRAEDLSGTPENELTLPALEEDVTYTAKWLNDDTALTSVTYTLNGKEYPCPQDEGDDYRLCLPAGTDLTGGVVQAQAKSDSTSVYIMQDDTDPGLWTVRATPESGHVKTYQVTIDLSHAAPTLADGQTGQVAATVAPSSMDGETAAQTYTADLSRWFYDPDGEALTYTLADVTVDGVAAELPTLQLTGGMLSFTPGVSDAGKVLRFTVSAANQWFAGPSVTVAITVGAVPPDQPPVEPDPTPTPTAEPTPTVTPTATAMPSETATAEPTETPSTEPPETPSATTTATPSATATATATPSATVTAKPSATPSTEPSATPSAEPPETPSAEPTETPSTEPSTTPSAEPPETPSAEPSETPSAEPSATPSAEPSATPSAEPTETPSAEPTETPSAEPSTEPSATPTQSPSPSPSPAPSPSTRPSSSRPSRPNSSKADPPATPAAPVPAVVTVGEEGGARLELKETRPLTQGERQAVIRANAEGAVTIRGAGLQVVIPKGVARSESQVDDLMADVTQARTGDVVVRTDAQGKSHAVALSMVEAGRVVYVADGEGRYAVKRGGATFADATDHWAREAITFSADRELTRGMSEDCFDPERHATRAMVFTLLARLEGTDLPASQGEWYDSAVTWAKDRGLSDGTRPQGDVTREELVTLLWREMGQPQADGDLEGFTDHFNVSTYARQAMVWAVKNGIISGRTDASIDPATGATRAETAAILQRFIAYQLEQQLGE